MFDKDTRENDYGTRGTDSGLARTGNAIPHPNAVAAKMAAQRSNSLDVPTESAADYMQNNLEQTLNILQDTLQMQDSFISRMFGPRPEEKTGGGVNPSNQGKMGLVQERLEWIRVAALRIRENHAYIERLG